MFASQSVKQQVFLQVDEPTFFWNGVHDFSQVWVLCKFPWNPIMYLNNQSKNKIENWVAYTWITRAYCVATFQMVVCRLMTQTTHLWSSPVILMRTVNNNASWAHLTNIYQRHLCLAFHSFLNHLRVCIVPGSKLQSLQTHCIFWIFHDESTDVHHHVSNLVWWD